jgi:hypothetical protein
MALDVVMLIGVGVKLDDAVDPVHIRTGISFYSAYTVVHGYSVYALVV